MELISTRLSAAFVSNAQAGEREKERDGRPYFSFKEGFTLLPRRRLFVLTPYGFLDKNRENMWAQMHQVRSGWFGWRMLWRRVAFNPQNQFPSRKTSPY